MQNSLTEKYLIPTGLQERGLSRCFRYIGKSMIPTFCPGQLLYVRSNASDIIPGDVIVFEHPSGKNHTVHRVVSVSDRGWVTRGDNNRLFDLNPVSPNHLIGRVEAFDDHGRIISVIGGKRGLWLAQVGWMGRRIENRLLRFSWKPYNAVRSSPLIRQFLYRWFSQYLNVVYLSTHDGPLVKTTYQGHTVALWRPHQNYFECRKPYDLFIPRPDGTE
jgi:hypothetical protein